jgi:hypothetical protein
MASHNTGKDLGTHARCVIAPRRMEPRWNQPAYLSTAATRQGMHNQVSFRAQGEMEAIISATYHTWGPTVRVLDEPLLKSAVPTTSSI